MLRVMYYNQEKNRSPKVFPLILTQIYLGLSINFYETRSAEIQPTNNKTDGHLGDFIYFYYR